MYAHELYEAGKPQVVVTYPGRFQPFHQGHAGVFAQLQKQFGRDSVYILTSNDQSSAKSPFNFTDKYQLMTAAGVPGDRIIETNQMYKLPEGFDPASTVFITAVGGPDKDRLNPDTFTKRDQKDKEGNVIKPAGSPSYYKTWDPKNAPMTADQHGYVVVIPEIKKSVAINGKNYDVSHGTECRNLWNQVRDNAQAAKEFLTGLYGRATPELVAIFNKIPAAVSEDIGQVDSNFSSSPISGARVFHEIEDPKEKHYHDWQEFDQDRTAQVVDFLRELQPGIIAKFGEEYITNLAQKAVNAGPQRALTQLVGDVIRAIKQEVVAGDGLKESYEYMPPGASMAQTHRVLKKLEKPAGKFVWMKPRQISGSYTDQQLLSKGFKQSQFGSWGGTEEMWRKLSALDEVAMNPGAFAQSIKDAQGKGVLVGFEFEVCIPEASVSGRAQQGPVTIPTFNSDDNSWIENKTVKDLLERLHPPITTENWSSIFHDLFKNKASVSRELGKTKIMDVYNGWVDKKISAMAAVKIGPAAYKKVIEILNDPEIATFTITAERSRPEGTAKEIFIRLLADKGLDVTSPDFKPKKLDGDKTKAILDASTQMYYWLPSGIDGKFRDLREISNSIHNEFQDNFYVQNRNDASSFTRPIENFSEFCREVYGTDNLKELLKTKWAFRGRTNNATPVLKEKLWYYLTPNAPIPQSLQSSRYSRRPSYTKGAEFLKQNLVPVFGDSITIFTGYHQAPKKLDRWYIEPDGSLHPNNDEDYSAEIVSPPLPAQQAMTALNTFYQKAQEMRLYTNQSTGLHINVSIPDTLDVLKLAMFAGDQYVLKKFGRENNHYARSVIKNLQSGVTNLSTNAFPGAEQELQSLAKNISRDHFATVNFNGKYVSFRHAGGDYLNKLSEITNTVGRFIRAMIIAADPAAYRNEYLNKLSRLVGSGSASKSTGTGVDSLTLAKMMKSGIPAIKYDAMLRQGHNDPNVLIVATTLSAVGDLKDGTSTIRQDPSVRERLLAAPGFTELTKEYIRTAPENIFYTANVYPITKKGLDKITSQIASLQINPGRAEGLYDQRRDRPGIGVPYADLLTRSSPLFNNVITTLRGKTISGPKAPLPEEAAGVGVVAKNKKMAKDPRYSTSITKDVKPSTPKNMLRAFRLAEDFAARINPADFEIKNFDKLDFILKNLCEMVVAGQRNNPEVFGMVAACVLDPDNQFAFGINYLKDDAGRRVHAERCAIQNYEAEYGRVPAGSIILTTLSPCCHPMDERYGDSCTEIINDTDCHKVYCGYKDPTQEDDMNKTFHVMQTRNPAIIKMCKKFAATFLGNDVVKENEENRSVTEEDMMTMIKEFMPLAMKALKLRKVPHIVLQPHVETHGDQATFGRFVNEEEKIYLGIADRHPVDILRTLAHELVHFKQYEQGRMYDGAGDTGSPIENEAHWVAGIIMRHFNKKYPNAIKSKPLELEENFADGRNPQDKGDSARHGIPKKASLANLDKIVHSKTASPRKKQLAHWQANMRRGREK